MVIIIEPQKHHGHQEHIETIHEDTTETSIVLLTFTSWWDFCYSTVGFNQQNGDHVVCAGWCFMLPCSSTCRYVVPAKYMVMRM